MKGNIRIKFKINKYIALIGLSTIGLYAMADFVSIINSNEVSYVAAEPEPEVMTVGAVVLRIDNVDPSTIYGGTWELITGDASLRLGNGAIQSGNITGNGNTPQVILPKHTHTATQVAHSHNRGDMEIYGTVTSPTANNVSVGYSLAGEHAFQSIGGKGALDDIDHWANQGSIYRAVDFRASRNWTGTTNSAAPDITVSESGNDNETIDVRGQFVKVNVWKKIN